MFLRGPRFVSILFRSCAQGQCFSQSTVSGSKAPKNVAICQGSEEENC